ncbi:hypothetical protein DEO72_LG7g1339 [Vigna unguiculata]|uniref:Uncharacterized protein n=1 Tax=Vigna unguiculata TaxID=3917 RepID=A0A4D6MF38_VIGUN|nr:hypothetical protein DEO72_LG7g1339 [Vigna unguiculata]
MTCFGVLKLVPTDRTLKRNLSALNDDRLEANSAYDTDDDADNADDTDDNIYVGDDANKINSVSGDVCRVVVFFNGKDLSRGRVLQ